jgi:CheY-like chemotaxis protein
VAENHQILPVLVNDDGVFVAMANPCDKKVIDELEFVTGRKVFPYVALSSALKLALESAYDMKARGEAVYLGTHANTGGTALRPGERQSAPPAPTARVEEHPPVVMDDAMDRAARAVELSEDDFGSLSEEISQVDLRVINGSPEQGSSATAGQKTILLVDDEADIRKMLRRFISEKGYRVVEADRGLAALGLVKRHAPDLIILDAMLPEVHGFEIARRIKNSQKYGHIPIIMISAVYRGWRYAEDVKTSYGVLEYIEKPFRIADVFTAVQRAFSAIKAGSPQESADETGSVEAERALADGVAAYQSGDIDGAIEHLRRGVAIDPLAYRLHFHLGLLLGKKDLIYEAIRALETALDINSRHYPALRNLAVLYQKAGFRNKAIEMWERTLAVAPDDPSKQPVREHLLGLL